MEKIQLLKNTVHYHIQNLSTDTEHNLLMQLKSYNNLPFQINESKGVSGLAVLHVFVCYCYKNKIQEDLLCNKSLESHTTGRHF
jgi:hypothetical protein